MAIVRPVVEVVVPLDRATIILALDVSRSMCAMDVEPDRLTVPQEAGLTFTDGSSEGTPQRLGGGGFRFGSGGGSTGALG